MKETPRIEEPKARLRVAVFDALAQRQGAETNPERAQLVGMSRAHFARLHSNATNPGLALAMRIARVLGVHVEDVFEYAPERRGS